MVPWTEKYRPKTIETVVKTPENDMIINKIMNCRECFPNLLFCGPPGTGKTTTITNMVEEYQTRYFSGGFSWNNVIHLNASDDRGIDIVRNNLKSFISTKSFFFKEKKFVILDEVDCMTKHAQRALKELIKSGGDDVTFILAANYVSKIDKSLLNLFIILRYYSLPYKNIYKYLEDICKAEKIQYTEKWLSIIIEYFENDARSMVNYIQSNSNNIDDIESFVFVDDLWCNIISTNDLKQKKNMIKEMIIKYNFREVVLSFMKYFINSEKVFEISFDTNRKIETLYNYQNKDTMFDKKSELLYDIVCKIK